MPEKTEAQDAGQTSWGRYLIDRFQAYLADQAELLRRALRLAQTQEDLGPKYGPTLQENLRQLEALGACRTWEALRAHRLEGFGRLNAVRKPKDPELAERIKALRKSCWEGVKARQAPLQWTPTHFWGLRAVPSGASGAGAAGAGVCQSL